jgi:hypothetical protein
VRRAVEYAPNTVAEEERETGMAELLITAVWLLTLGAIVYFAAAELSRLLSIQDAPRRRRRQGAMTTPGTMHFDVTTVEREALRGKQARYYLRGRR